MLYKISNGATQDEHYGNQISNFQKVLCSCTCTGLALARLVDLPQDILERAEFVSVALAKNIEQKKRKSNAHLAARKRALVLQLKELLTQVMNGKLYGTNLRAILTQAQQEFVQEMTILQRQDPDSSSETRDEASEPKSPRSCLQSYLSDEVSHSDARDDFPPQLQEEVDFDFSTIMEDLEFE